MANKAYTDVLNTRTQARTGTPQTQAIPGREKDMVRNSQGGVSFSLDGWGRLDRFLILGTEGGSYYASQQKLTVDNAKNLQSVVKTDGVRVVSRIIAISEAGRAPKNDPALFALAVAMTDGDAATQNAAFEAIPRVARIGTHVLHLAQYVKQMRTWGRGVRRGFGNWYNGMTPLQLAMQLTKYANRDGWTHADILKLAHPHPATSAHDALFSTVLGKDKPNPDEKVAAYLDAVNSLRKETDPKKAVKLILDHRLPREVVPTELLTDKNVWGALLSHMGMEAMVRNLATMTRVGLISPNSDGTRTILEKMANEEVVRKSRLHPIKVLAAQLTYAQGHGVRGSNTWTPVQNVLSGLDDLFYATFWNVIPTGKRTLLALDVSASMTGGQIAGVPGLTPRVGSAAMAAVTMRTEKMYEVVGFTSGGGMSYYGARRHGNVDNVSGITRLALNSKMNVDKICRTVNNLPFGGTDCSLPMEWARVNNIPVDTFVIYTDSETAHGARHPSQALRAYREATGIPARLVVVGMVANNFTIADPNDVGMMDVVGFDTATPTIISDFSRGDF